MRSFSCLTAGALALTYVIPVAYGSGSDVTAVVTFLVTIGCVSVIYGYVSCKVAILGIAGAVAITAEDVICGSNSYKSAALVVTYGIAIC